MGLDMYLYAKKYVNRKVSYDLNAAMSPKFAEVVIASGLGDFTEDESVDIYGTEVSVTAAYWRKANAIHNWFVNNVQEGEDDCKEYYVSLDDLEALRNVCNEILLHKDDTSIADDLLPTGSGFFFGSTEYDEWYYENIEYTSKRLKEIIKFANDNNANNNYVGFYYQSSW